jgi:ATP-binding cassette, subfamily B, bacterial
MMHRGGWWSLISSDDSQQNLHVDRYLLKRVAGYARPYWVLVLLDLVAIIASSLIELVPPLLYRDLIDNVIPTKNLQRLTLLALGMIAIPIVDGLIGVAERYFSAKAGEGIIFDLRQQLYEHVQKMSIRFFTKTKSGEIISRLNNDVVGAQGAITGTLPNIVTNLVTLVSTLIVMISIEWRLTLLSIAVLPLFLLPARRVAGIFREIRRKAMEYNSDMSNQISETLSINGSLLVKTFGRESEESSRFEVVNRKVRDIGVRRAIVGRWFFLGLGISGAIGTAIIYWAGGYMTITGVLSVGTIVAFVAYLARLYGPISALTNVQVEFASSMVSFERVFEYLDMPVEIQNRPGALEIQNPRGKIKFENVTFSYDRLLVEAEANGEVVLMEGTNGDNGENEFEMELLQERALNQLSFEIDPGQLVALVGHSGAGKTTITYLLPRLYDPTEGCITLDGIDLRDISLESLAQSIGIVTQEPYLFHDTVRRNLLYAKPEATESELAEACRAANILEFIERLPDGLDTIVGERGYRLSGGEKQRLAIARVILKDPRLLILDEATSHLDSHNEALIQEALTPLFSGRTSLVIAHRLSTILAADKILVLEKGSLIEEGTHADLLALEGLYASLYETQFKTKKATLEAE